MAIPRQNSGHKINIYRGNKMQKLDLIIAALSGGGLALLIIGAVENIFTSSECLIGGAVCFAALMFSLNREV